MADISDLQQQISSHLIDAERRLGPIEEFCRTHDRKCQIFQHVVYFALSIIAVLFGGIFTQIVLLTGRGEVLTQRQDAQAERMIAEEATMIHQLDLMHDDVKVIRERLGQWQRQP